MGLADWEQADLGLADWSRLIGSRLWWRRCIGTSRGIDAIFIVLISIGIISIHGCNTCSPNLWSLWAFRILLCFSSADELVQSLLSVVVDFRLSDGCKS